MLVGSGRIQVLPPFLTILSEQGRRKTWPSTLSDKEAFEGHLVAAADFLAVSIGQGVPVHRLLRLVVGAVSDCLTFVEAKLATVYARLQNNGVGLVGDSWPR